MPNQHNKKSPKDDSGNLLGCPFCDSDEISKNGFRKYKTGKKHQRYLCLKCEKVTMNPRIAANRCVSLW